MMKASIVSLYGNVNYGNKLQNFAVQEVMKKLGYETDVIYIQSKKSRIKQIMRSLIHKTLLKHFSHISIESKLLFKRQIAFQKFCKQYISERRYSSINQIHDSDVFILGSDQVWNPNFLNGMNKQLFFLTFTKPEKKVCFSPSFGLDNITEEWKPYYREKLATFPKISVREESGKEIVSDLTGKDAEVLVDPTMMINRDEWLSIAKKPDGIDFKNKYILTYFLGDIPEKALFDCKMANKDICGKVYRLVDKSCPELYACNPSEFIYLFNHASLVLTDSFHACVFSFLLGKPFLVYKREGIRNDMFTRIETLLSTFDLKRKYADSGLRNDIFESDYSTGYKRLEREQEKVYKFLKESLKHV